MFACLKIRPRAELKMPGLAVLHCRYSCGGRKGAVLFRLFSFALLTLALLLAPAAMFGENGAARAHSQSSGQSHADDHCAGAETPADAGKNGSESALDCLSICAAITAPDQAAPGAPVLSAAPRGELPLTTLIGNHPARDPPPPRIS